MPKLTAKRKLVYAAKKVAVGEEFETNDRDARTLVAIGSAAYARPEAKATYMNRAMVTEPGSTLHLPKQQKQAPKKVGER